MGIVISKQSVQALNIYADAMEKMSKSMNDDLEVLKNQFSSSKEELGPHASAIGSIIRCVETALETGQEPMSKMPAILRNKAAEIDQFINNEPGLTK